MMHLKRTTPYMYDIRFWLLVFFILRLYGITDPPLEISHNWRQVTVNMVARNYFEGNTHFFYPMMDNAGEKTGITGTEFPLLNYSIHLCAKLFGWEHWYGRLINLLISTLGIFFFYKWIKKFIHEGTAFPAAMILITSLWFAFSRKAMPDTFSLSIASMGLYAGFEYLTNRKLLYLLAYFIFGTLGILCKLPAIVVLSPLLVKAIYDYLVQKKILFEFIGVSFAILGINFLWYYWWFNELIAIGNWQFYMMGPGFPKGLFELFSDPYESFDNIFFEALKFSGFIAFLTGVFLLIRDKTQRMLGWILLLWGALFFLFMIQAGYGYSTHDYYTLPLVQALALGAGFAVSKIKRPTFKVLVLFVIMLEGLFNVLHDFKIKKEHQFYTKLESTAAKYIPEKSFVICDEGMNPRMLYFLHRKGWSLDLNELQDETYIDSLRNKGAEYLVVKTNNTPIVNYNLIAEENNVRIYRLIN